ncbi:hypothetical protein E2562_000195, partial [Oryza meyeriana var. granulata]
GGERGRRRRRRGADEDGKKEAAVGIRLASHRIQRSGGGGSHGSEEGRGDEGTRQGGGGIRMEDPGPYSQGMPS